MRFFIVAPTTSNSLSFSCYAEAAALGASATLLPGHSVEVAFDAGVLGDAFWSKIQMFQLS